MHYMWHAWFEFFKDKYEFSAPNIYQIDFIPAKIILLYLFHEIFKILLLIILFNFAKKLLLKVYSNSCSNINIFISNMATSASIKCTCHVKNK